MKFTYPLLAFLASPAAQQTPTEGLAAAPAVADLHREIMGTMEASL